MESTTHWILQVKEGNPDAAEQIWRRYYSRLVEFARGRLHRRTPSGADEEDIALSAFNSFYRAAEAGRFPDLQDSSGLWRLLITIAARKVSQYARADQRLKRSTDRLASNGWLVLEEQIGSEPSPEFVAETLDTLRQLLSRLAEGSLRQVAIYRMEGYSNHEIAQLLDCSLSTVERKLRLIRRIFSDIGNLDE